MTPSYSSPATDTFTDDLTAHLQARRDEVAAATTMPSLDVLLERPAPLGTIDSSGPRRRTTTIALAAAAVLLLVVGVVALTRDDTQRVSTRPSASVRALVDSGVPLLLPAGEATAQLTPTDLSMPGMPPIPTAVEGSVETRASGKVGEAAKILTLVVAGPHDETLADPFRSLQGSDMFDPSDWFDHPEHYPNDGISTTTDLAASDFPGADRAILATSPDRPSTVAVLRGTQRIAVYGLGVTEDELTAAAAGLVYSDAGTATTGTATFGELPQGFAPLVPPAAQPHRVSPYSARSSAGSIGVSALRDAAYDAASSLNGTGGVSARWTVLRGAPHWVLQLDGSPRRVHGIRDGAWIGMYLPKGGGLDGPVALAAFDTIRVVDDATFTAALGSGVRERDAQIRKGVEENVARIRKWGGWLPDLPTGAELDGMSLLSPNPPTLGGLTGLEPLWDPATGATLGIGDVITSGPASDPEDTLLETVTLGGRATELRSWPQVPGDVHAVFDDGDGHRVQTFASGVSGDQIRAYVDSIRRTDDGTWTATPPPGFEPFPLARPADAEATRPLITRGSGKLDGATLRFTLPDDAGEIAVELYRPDPTVAADALAQFIVMGRAEPMTTTGTTWYRLRDMGAAEHRVAIPGTASRPTVTVASDELTDEQLFGIATSVRQVSNTEIERVLAPLLGG